MVRTGFLSNLRKAVTVKERRQRSHDGPKGRLAATHDWTGRPGSGRVDGMASDVDIQATIRDLIAEEHRLREAVSEGALAPADEQARLGEIEIGLDQCWDLLRQRRARREFGEDPDQAEVRSEGVVEGYLG